VLYLVGFDVMTRSSEEGSCAAGTPPPPRLVFFAPYLVDIAY
jgi:hypothetical protein